MSLITKYRPTTFGAVVGNKGIITEIKNLLEKDEPKRSFLLSGPRGCGKTTIGRIIASHVGCDMDNDFIELDAAHFRGVDTVRELLKTVNYTGLGGGVRVYLLDECHQLTKEAQEALLKTIEQPPEHAYFILATTDPDKLKPTLVDRCSHGRVVPLEFEECIKFLKKIVRKEKKQVPQDVLEMIVEKAQGRPRSSLALLEKVLDLEEDQMIQVIEEEKGLEYKVIDLCRALLQAKKWNEVTVILDSIKDEDPENVRRAVLGYCTSVLMKKQDPQAFLIMDIFRKPFYVNGKPDLVFACYNVYEEVR